MGYFVFRKETLRGKGVKMNINLYYRAAAAVILYNPSTQLYLAGKRSDNRYGNDSWQFPQGGIKKKQSDIEAAITELYEETGIPVSESDLIQVLPCVTVYQYSEPRKKKGRGQVHHWFLFNYTGLAELRNPQDDEFSKLSWMKFGDIVKKTASIRVNPYEQVQDCLKSLGYST